MDNLLFRLVRDRETGEISAYFYVINPQMRNIPLEIGGRWRRFKCQEGGKTLTGPKIMVDRPVTAGPT